MSQNTCERSGVRKYKLRVRYFDHITQKKMVSDSRQKKIWNFMDKLGAKESVILKLLSPMTLWCFRKYFLNWHWNFLVVSCCLRIRSRSYLSLFPELPEVHFWEPSELDSLASSSKAQGGWVSSRQRWRDITALNHRQFTSVERSGLQTLLHGTS